MFIKKCPKCLSAKINLFAGAITGEYHCQKCNYVGTLILEEEVDPD
tara:strand:- start:6758 stop:6895 length:138 start_codon:yes stop_codon:yes gene_type:complete